MKTYTILSQTTSRWLGRPARKTTSNAKSTSHLDKPVEPLPPPVMIQVYEILRDHGFSFDEARELASQAATTYLSTTQRLFQIGPVTVEISACVARLVHAPRHHETARRTLERINTLENIELDRREREIREMRQRNERRRPW